MDDIPSKAKPSDIEIFLEQYGDISFGGVILAMAELKRERDKLHERNGELESEANDLNEELADLKKDLYEAANDAAKNADDYVRAANERDDAEKALQVLWRGWHEAALECTDSEITRIGITPQAKELALKTLGAIKERNE